jgi:hypothetical protein
MGFLTKGINKVLGIERNIIPMGSPSKSKAYDRKVTYRQVVADHGMDPERVDVISDGDDVNIDASINDSKDITIMPKQKGGAVDFGEDVSACIIGYILDPASEDQKLWDKIEKYVNR